VITARLVGDDAVLAWLRATPDVVASGLARAVAKLGLDLQRKIQEGDLTAQMLSDRSFQPSSDAQIEQSGDKISVTVSAAANMPAPANTRLLGRPLSGRTCAVVQRHLGARDPRKR
jgi:hypothetical protein